MAKALLMSVLFATILIPIYASRDPRPSRGMRRTITWFLAFVAFYVFACLVIYPRL
jgi:hypothetical protein